MRDVLSTVSKIMFYVMAAVVLAWTASLTLALVGRLLPGDSITPFFALMLFDGGALTWGLAFLFQAQGLGQRSISLLAMIVDLVGVIAMSMAELFLGGQQLTAVPEGLGMLVVYGVGIWTAINVLAVYAYHIADTGNLRAIRVQSLQDKVTDEALNQLEANIRDEAAQLAGRIAGNMRQDVLAGLRLYANEAPKLIEPATNVYEQTADTGNSDINPTQAGEAKK